MKRRTLCRLVVQASTMIRITILQALVESRLLALGVVEVELKVVKARSDVLMSLRCNATPFPCVRPKPLRVISHCCHALARQMG